MDSECFRVGAVPDARHCDTSNKLQCIRWLRFAAPECGYGSTSLPSDQRTPQKYFNTAAFYTAPIYTLENASRDPVRGPGYGDLDIALSKNFTLPRDAGIEFRAEIYNLANTPAFAQPNGSFGSPAFGSITSTISDSRVVQFAIRIYR